jgi:hypothetical protein
VSLERSTSRIISKIQGNIAARRESSRDRPRASAVLIAHARTAGSVLSYVELYRLSAVMTIAVLPLVLLMRRAPPEAGAEPGGV